MNVKAACEHGKWDSHYGATSFLPWCPGGRVLEQAIIIERENGEWPEAMREVLGQALVEAWQKGDVKIGVLFDALASAQEEQ